MKDQDFNCSITANVSAGEAMYAISNVSGWWAKDFSGSAKNLGDEFTVRFGTTWVAFKITAFIPGNKISWTVTDCYLPWLTDKTEWTGTTVIFEISVKNNQATINFTHHGLVPAVECYDACVNGWTRHITGSLQNLLNTGIGEPQ